MNEFLSVEAGERAPQRLRRRALDLADQVLAALARIDADAEAVHDARRKLKELRALVRLVGDVLPRRGKPERGFFRDAGRLFAPQREAIAAVETFDSVRAHFTSEWKPREFLQIRRALVEHGGAAADPAAIERLRADLAVERGRIAAWPVDSMSSDDLWKGLERSYRRSRQAMRSALHDRTPQDFHRWRRRAKTLWHQEQFFAALGMGSFADSIKTLHKLGRSLGEHHDLALLDERCGTASDSFGSSRYVRRFRRFLHRRLRDLEERAESTGSDLFAARVRDWARVSGSPLAKRVGPKKVRQRLRLVHRENAG
ncbi:MAG TPA: CHAD domain-containing protein [Thermoanaerobaculia bacterium]|nr:CHAD domain-containing protein [Thermoanaerobaculia bacterium]